MNQNQMGLEEIREHSEQFTAMLGDDLNYDEETLSLLEGILERKRGFLIGNEEAANDLTLAVGYFLGECIRRNYGGEWEMREGRWAIKLDDEDFVFPFTKVAKFIANGSEDSFLSFYGIIDQRHET